MQALALKDLSDPDPDIAARAIYLLIDHGDPSVAKLVVSTYLQMVSQAPKDPKVATAIQDSWVNVSGGARTLLANDRWRLAWEQKRRLEAVASFIR